MLAYAVKDRLAGDEHIGEWIYDEDMLGDVIGALCWPVDKDKRSIPGWSWVWPTIYGKAKPPGPPPVATPGGTSTPSYAPVATPDVAAAVNDVQGQAVNAINPGSNPGGAVGAPGNPGQIGPAGNPQGLPQGGGLQQNPGNPQPVNNGVLYLGIGGTPLLSGGGFATFTVGGSSSLSALTGMVGVGTGSGFATFSFGGSSSAASLSGIPGVGTGSSFARFIMPQDPYRNPFANPKSTTPANKGGNAAQGGGAGDGNGGANGAAGPGGQNGDIGQDGQPVGQVDPATQPATGDKQSGCGTMNNDQAKLRPIRDDSWTADERYKQLDLNKCPTWAKMPKGVYGLTVCATEEKKQIELFFPSSPFFGIAVNAAGDPKTGSDVSDENSDFEIDKDRQAKLQSAFWVLQKPLGGENAIAINYGDTGCEDTEGGYIIDRGATDTPPSGSAGPAPGSAYPSGPANGAGGPGAGGPDKSKGGRIAARMSKNKGGPIWVGSKNDKHHVGKTKDGIPINKGHIWTGALFRKNDDEDGPILFEDVYRQGQDQDIVVPCHLSWNGGAQMWMIWSTCLSYPPDPPPPYPPPPYPPPPYTPNGGTTTPGVKTPGGGSTGGSPGDKTGGSPGGGTRTPYPDIPTFDPIKQHPDGTKANLEDPFYPYSPGDYPIGPSNTPVISSDSRSGEAMRTVNMVSPVAAAGFVGQAQNYQSGAMDTGTFSKPNVASIAKQASSNPVTGVVSAFGAQGGNVAGSPASPSSPATPPSTTPASGDPANYTTAPRGTKLAGTPGKWPSGTAPGGFVIHPPETDLRDVGQGMVPRNTPVSTTYWAVTTGAWFAAGIPQLENGSMKSGYSWGYDSATGDLIFRSHLSGQAADIHTALRLTQSAMTVQWYCGKSVYGELSHANTGNRTYTFPDVTGTVGIVSNVVADNGAGTPVTHGHTGGSGPVTAAISKWIVIRASDGLDYFVEGWR